MNDPLVTVAIPSYNRAPLLTQAIESVLAQDFQEFEVLVSDDASPYDVAALIASFADDRIHLIQQPRNLGMVKNYRVALTTPQTRYIAHLDDDDLWLPHHLSQAMMALESRPGATLYSCAAQTFGDRHNIVKPYWCTGAGIQVYRWEETGFAPWLYDNPVQSSSVVFRREALHGLFWGGESWPWCNDWLWWGQLALKGSFVFNPQIGVQYRWHASNITRDIRDRPSHRDKAQWLCTVRELAKQAWYAGALRDLAGETRQFPASVLSTVVIALTAPESPPGLAHQARQIFESRPDISREAGCAMHYRIATTVGGWWLRYADVTTRLLGRWWPVPDS